MLIKQSSSNKVIPFFLVDATDHIAPKTGLTPTVTISKNGAAFASPAGSITEIGSGWYKIAGNATDSNTIGSLLVHATGTGADPFDVIHEVIEATLAKGTDITGFNDISTANVQTELTTYGALKPTTAGRTLDVSTGGEAGLDWANIGAPTTSQTLSATTIATVTNLTNDPPGVTTLLARVTSTIFTGITSLKEWLGLLAGKQVGNSTARTEIRSTGAGSGTFDETADSQEALRDRGDAAWGADVWATAVPGAYGAGTAGNILGNRLDVAVSTRATPAQVAIELTTYGALKPTTAGRTLDVTAGGEAGIDLDNTVGTLAKGTDITGFNDISTANVQSELVTYGALKPTVAARTLDVSATGEAGVDWANVGSPTTAQNLSGTTIKAVTDPVTLTAAYDAAKTAATQASVNAVDDFVDSEVAAIKVVTDKLDSALELDGAVYRYTVNALEQAPSGGSGGATAGEIADAVWDEPISGHLTAGSTGAALNGAGSAGDPWTTVLPGAYGAGTAGNIVGTNLNATVSSRATPAQVQGELVTYGGLKPTVAGRTLDVTATGEAGVDLDNTAGTLAKGTDITGFNDLSAANVQAELVTYGALKPTTAGRTLDVSINGEAGVDWGNIGNPATAQNLSATTISTSQTVATVTNSVTLTSAYDAAKTAATQASVNTLATYVDTEVAAIKAKTDNLPVDPADASDLAASFVTVNGKLDTISGAVDTEVAAIKAKTDNLPANPASVGDIPTAIQNADAFLKRDMAAVTGEASRSPLNAMRLLRNKWSAVETPNTLTVKKEDDTTTAWTAPLTTDSAAAPITGMDPT